MIVIPFGFMAAAAATPDDVDLLLNNIPYATGAFGLRKLDKNYPGSCIKVRESGGDTLADIGFDSNGDLDISTLTGHTGGNSGYVHTWYDQSGLGYNATQTTNGSQPQIVNSGTVDVLNGKTAILFDGNGYFTLGDIPGGTDATLIGLQVGSKDQTTPASYSGPCLVGSQASSRPYLNIHHTDNKYYTKSAAVGTAQYAATDTFADDDQHLMASYAPGVGVNNIVWRDGSVIANTADSTTSTQPAFNQMGRDETTNQRGYLQEIIYYDEDRYIELTKGLSDIGALYKGWSEYSLFSTEFDGVADYVETGLSLTALNITNKFTVSCWFYAETLSEWDGIFGCASAGNFNDGFAAYWRPSTGLVFFVGVYSVVANRITTPISTGQWYHFLGCYDGSLGADNMELFIDGSSVGTSSRTGNVPDAGGLLRIATVNSTGLHYGMNGNVDEFAIWNTDERANATTIYNSGVPADLTDLSPTSWWRMGDESGWPYLTNKMAYSKYSMNFDGVDDYVEASTLAEVGISGTAFSVSFWIKHAGSLPNYATFLGGTSSSSWNNGFGCTFLTTTTPDELRFWVNGWNTAGTYATIPMTTTEANSWVHVVCVYDGTNTKIYKNGGVGTDGTLAAAITTTTSPFMIGRAETSTAYGDFNGNIDEVATWNTALTSGNVTTIFNNGVPDDISGLNPVAYYKMGEGTIFPQIPNEMAYSKQSMNFDGVTAVVTLPTFATILGTTNVFSVSLWVNPAAFANYDGFIGSSTNQFWGDGFGIGYNAGSANMNFWINGYGNTAAGAYAITSNYGKWVHIVGVYDGTLGSANTKIYINGVVGATTDDFTANVTATGNNIVIGRVNNQAIHAIEANFDDVSIFSTALSQSDVTSIYNNGVPNDISALSPVGWWKMGDGDYFPTLTDSGSGSNNGTAENMAGADIKLDTPNGWGTAYNETAAEMIQGDTPGGNGGTMMINMTQADIVQDAPKYSRLSVNFDGVSEFVQLGEPITGPDPKTVSMWIKPASITSNDRILSNDDNTSHALSISFGASAIEFYASGIGNQAITTVMPTVGEWSHLVIVWAGTSSSGGGTATGYLNGGNSATATIATGPHGVYSSAFQNISLGAMLYGIWGTTFHGNIDEVAMWSSALPLTEITTIYNNGRPTDISSLSPVGWWRMGEGSTYPTIIDDGSGSNNGAMTNMAAANIEYDTPE